MFRAHSDVLEMKGDRARGKAVFKKECSRCHKLEGVGYDLGLPLTSIKQRGPEGILLNVLDPNRDLKPEYANYVVVTDQGRTISGMIVAETATSVTLQRAEEESDSVLRINIDELIDTGISLPLTLLKSRAGPPECIRRVAISVISSSGLTG